MPQSLRTKSRFYTTASVTALIGMVSLAGPVLANPRGGQVVGGDAQISGEGTATVAIDQSTDRAILNWDSFSIDANESVIFRQPDAKSITANRVVGQDPSKILGNLTANGQVVLINRNGIAFGKDSVVDVAGLVATTADMDDAAFMGGAETLRFDAVDGSFGEIVIQGHISVKDAGLAAFVAPHVQNDGVILADLGRVALGGAEGFSVDLYGDGLISFAPGDEVSGTLTDATGASIGALVENSGSIRASGGKVLLTASAARDLVHASVNTSGLISASSATANGGTITLSGPGKVSVAGEGRLDVSSESARAGTVKVLGETAALLDTAKIVATGATGGGEVLVGGNYLGQGPETNAKTTVMAPDAIIDASATAHGDGGRVILWSDEHTNAWGTILARGGADGGDGGFVETSSKNHLNMVGTVDAGAPVGTGGTWLLDPGDVIIADSGQSGTAFNPAADFYEPTGNSTIIAANIEASLANNNVFITTGNNDGYSVTQNAAIEWNSEYGLTLSAGGDMIINNSIVNGGTGGITLLAAQGYHDRAVTINDGALLSTQGGDITLYGGKNAAGASTNYRGSVVVRGLSSISSNGGDIRLENTTAGAGQQRGVDVRGTVDAGTGDVFITGYGRTGGDNSQDTAVTLESLALSGGNITVFGDTQGTGDNRIGIRLVDTVDVRASGNLTLTGKARGGMGTLSGGHGMGIATSGDFGATDLTLYAAGDITLDGTATTADRFAVDLRRTGASTVGKVRIGHTEDGDVTSGDITIKGTASGTGGLYLGGQTLIRTNGGDVTMGGTESSVGQVIFGQVNFDNDTDYGAITLGSSTATLYNTPDGAGATDFTVSAAGGLSLLTRGGLNVNYDVTNTAATGGIDILGAWNAEGVLRVDDNRSLSAAGDIRLLAGTRPNPDYPADPQAAPYLATGAKGTVWVRPGASITSTDGDIAIANGTLGTGQVRGIDVHGSLTATNGEVSIIGYGSPGVNDLEDTAVTLEELTINANDISVYGNSQGSGNGRIGVRFVYNVDLRATNDLSITGISYGGRDGGDASDGDGITTYSGGVNNLTLFAGGNLKLDGRASGSGADAINLIISSGGDAANTVKIGYVDDETVTNGNIEIVGNSQQWINLGDITTIRSDGGDVTIGDNGSALARVAIKNDTIDRNYTYRNITLGGTQTRDTLIQQGTGAPAGFTYAATGALNLIDYDGIDIAGNFTNTAEGGGLGFYVAQGDSGRMNLTGNLQSNGGDITIYAGRDINDVETGSRGSLYLNSSTQANSIVSNGGDIDIANTSSGAHIIAGSGRGIDMRGTINADTGDITVRGFYAADAATSDSDVATTLEQGSLRGRNIALSGQSLGTGANDAEGVRFFKNMDIQATGDLSISGSSANARGVATWQSGAINLTLFAAGDLTVNGSTQEDGTQAVDFSRSEDGGVVRLGFTGDPLNPTTKTAGDISILGSATGAGGINMGTFARIRGNGGDVTIGDNGDRLDNVLMYKNTISLSDTFGTVTAGGTQTRNINIYGAGGWTLKATESMNFIDYDGVDIAANFTNTASGGDINIRATTGADGTLQILSPLITNGGDVTITAGLARDAGTGLFTENSHKGRVRLASNVTTTGGDVTILNSTLGSPNSGVDLFSSIDTTNGADPAGDVTIRGYSTDGIAYAATYIDGATIKAGDITILGQSTSNVASGGLNFGVMMTQTVMLDALGDIDIAGSSNTSKAIGFRGDPYADVTIFAAGNTVLNGSTQSMSDNVINFSNDNNNSTVRIGFKGSTITTGDITIIGSSPAYGFYFPRTTIKTDGGDVKIGDNGSALAQLSLASGLIDTTNAVGSLTLGGAKTGQVSLNGAYLAENDILASASGSLTVNSNATLTSQAGKIDMLSALGADGVLTIGNNSALTTTGGDITLLAGVDLARADTGSRGTVFMTGTTTTGGGDLYLANGTVGGVAANVDGRGVLFAGTHNLGSGDLRIDAYKSNGGDTTEAATMSAVTVRAHDVVINGTTTGVAADGIQFGGTNSLIATGDMTLTGTSALGAGIATFNGLSNSVTLLADGDLKLEGTTLADGRNAIDFTETNGANSVRLGYDDSNVTDGNITVIGSAPGAGQINFGSVTTIRSNGGDVTIGDNGSALGLVSIRNNTIDPNSTFGTITLGGVNTSNTYIYGGGVASWAASESITFIEKDGVDFGASLTNTATGGDINFYVATGADGKLGLNNGGFAFTADGNVNLNAGILPDGTVTGFKGDVTLGNNSRANAGDDITVRATDVLVLGTGTRLTATDGDIMVSTEGTGTFENYAGASALSAANGRWVVYANTPGATRFDGLVSGNNAIWNQANYDTLVGNLTANEVGGNRFAFASIPDTSGGYTVDTADQPNKTYGEAVAPPTKWSDFTIKGGTLGTNAGANSAYMLDDLLGLFDVTTTSIGYAATTNVGTYAVTASGVETFNGQAVSYQSSGEMTVDPRVVTLTGSQVYDSSTTIRAASLTAGNLVNGDTVTVLGAALDGIADADVGSRTLISTDGLSLSNLNYTVAGATGSIDITQATIGVSLIGGIEKVYDATVAATIATGNYQLTGVFGGDTVTLNNPASGTYADKNAGTGKAVTVTGLAISGADAGNYVLAWTSVTDAVGVITKADLQVTGVTADDKVYDATVAADIAGGAVSAISGDTITLVTAGATGTFANKNVGTGKVVSATGYTLTGADADNYQLVAPTGVTASISKKDLAIGGVSAIDKVYDSTVAAQVTAGSISAFAGDDVTLDESGVSASFADKTAGADKSVAVSGYALTGDDAFNYNLTAVTGLSATISKAALRVTGVSAADKTYDATRAAQLSGGAVDGLGSDEVALVTTDASGLFADKNVGEDKAVTVTGYTLSGADAANYSVVQPTDLVADITKASLSVDGVTARDKEYDTTRTAALVGGSVDAIGSDDVTLDTDGAAGLFADKNAGTDKAVTASGYALTGSDAGNYALVQPTGLQASITKAQVTVTGVSAADKTYDATTAAVLSGGSVAALAGDELQLVTGSAAGTFADKNVGEDKAVTVSGYSLGGADAANYAIAQPTGLTASIGKARLTVTGVAATDKTYDATTGATLTGGEVSALGSDDVVLVTSGATGAFANKNVGEDKAVTAAGYTIGGADAGNYTLVGPTDLTASITAAQLVVTGAVAADRDYDATRTASISGGSVSAFAGDDVSLLTAGVAGAFADKNVGDDKAVAVSGYALSGADASNYAVVQPTGLTASIRKASLIIAGVVARDRTYDSTTDAALVGGSVAGFTGDDVSLVAGGATGSFADKNAGSGKAVSASGYTIAGADAGNYSLLQPAGLTADIRKATVTVAGATAQDKVYDGTTRATVAGGAVSAFAGDDLSLDTSGVTASFADKNVGVAKQVAVSGYALTGADAGNYEVDGPADLRASIGKATLTVNGVVVATKTYDATRGATLVGGSVSAIGSDDVKIDASGANGLFANKNAGAGKAVAASGYGLAGADAGNYALLQPTGLTGDIAKATIGVGGAVARDKVYDATVRAAVSGGSVTGFGTDDLSLQTGGVTASFADKNVGTGKAVTASGYALGGTDAANYILVAPTGLTADITPAAVSIAGSFTAADKVYDATTQADIDTSGLSLSGLFGGDEVALVTDGATGSFADKNAGIGKTVTLSTTGSLMGADAANYRISSAAPTTLADITPFQLTLAYAGADKVYDGTVAANVDVTSDNRFAGDQLGFDVAAAYADKNVGDAKAVSIGGVDLTGADAGNYTVSNPTGALTAAISRLESVAWTGAGDGSNWFDAANWAGGAVPDLANVANVVLGAGVVVTFDETAISNGAEAGRVDIDSLATTLDADLVPGVTDSGLKLAAGSLAAANLIRIDSFAQSGGALGGTGALVVTDSFVQTGGTIAMGGDIRLNQGAGDLTFVSLAGANVTMTAPDGSIIAGELNATDDLVLTAGSDVAFNGNVTVGGDASVTADANGDGTGGITQGGDATLVIGGDTSLAAGEDIVLGNPANDFGGTVSANTGGALSLADANDLVLGTITTGTDLSVSAGDDVVFGGDATVGGNATVTADANGDGTGGITQGPDATLVIGGDTSLAAGEDIVLGNPANDFDGTVSANTGGTLSLADANDLDLGTITTGADLTVSAGDAVALGGNVTVGGNATVTADANGSGTGGITQDGAGTLVIGGDTSLAAGEDIVLDNPANDFDGTVSANTGGSLSLADANDLNLGAITTGADLTASAGDAVALGGSVNVGGDATVTADANGSGTGGITQDEDATIRVGGATSLAAGEDIVLGNPSNDFGGKVSAKTDGSLDLADANALDLGTIDVGMDFDVRSGGSLSGADRISIGGDTRIAAGGDVDLANPDSRFGGTVAVDSPASVNIPTAPGVQPGAPAMTAEVEAEVRSTSRFAVISTRMAPFAFPMNVDIDPGLIAFFGDLFEYGPGEDLVNVSNDDTRD